MALLDSKPAFKQRCIQFGIPESEIALLDDGDHGTFGAFAFVVPFANKDNADADDKLKASVTEMIGGILTGGQMSKYRRLLFESHAIVMSEARHRIDRTEESLPRKIPAPERVQRHKSQVTKYPDVSITGWNEPSHSLLDEVQSQREDQGIRYVPIERCTCRRQELEGIKKIKDTEKDPAGFIKVVEHDETITFDSGGDLFKIRQALVRRALAYDQAGVCSFLVLEKWSNKLFDLMQREPPPEFMKITLWQVLNADKELFNRLAEECREGLDPLATGKLPMEIAINSLMVDPTLNQFLVHLQGRKGKGKGHDKGPSNKGQDKGGGYQEYNRNNRRGKGDKGGRGKGGRGKGGGPHVSPYGNVQMPPGLEGCWSRIGRDPLCLKYNLGNCPDQGIPDGDKCSRGLHKCCCPKCTGSHPYFKCPNKAH